MLGYQHIYHAGNFADVQKHAVWVKLLKILTHKPQPFRVVDTHAGRGLYDLSSEEAQKTGEFRSGILPFWESRASLNTTPLFDYLTIVSEFNSGDKLKIY
ncbi:MAG: 23S rRNA (adenine(2030)-N(6))-methyltransferase RlmJ, partial [Proteobacteria bacterium]|nr:23S rRNA (adenine(2030)-N(6))-methyltransferase RlmJ [Pseudomonadota bacterium]